MFHVGLGCRNCLPKVIHCVLVGWNRKPCDIILVGVKKNHSNNALHYLNLSRAIVNLKASINKVLIEIGIIIILLLLYTYRYIRTGQTQSQFCQWFPIQTAKMQCYSKCLLCEDKRDKTFVNYTLNKIAVRSSSC